MEQQIEQIQAHEEQALSDIENTYRPSNLMPIKSKAQRIVTAFIGSVVAIVIVLTFFSDALGFAKSFFSNF